MVNQLDDEEREANLKWIIFKDHHILETIADDSHEVLKDFGFLKDYKNCKIGRSLRNPLFIHKLIPRIRVYVLIKNLNDIKIFNEPFLDFLTPPSIFNIVDESDSKVPNFRKF